MSGASTVARTSTSFMIMSLAVLHSASRRGFRILGLIANLTTRSRSIGAALGRFTGTHSRRAAVGQLRTFVAHNFVVFPWP